MPRWRNFEGQDNLFGQPLAWEQLDGEGSKAYQAFLEYRDMGPGRSIDAVGRKLYRSRGEQERKRGAPGGLRRWADQFQWVERVREWERYVQREADRATVQRYRDDVVALQVKQRTAAQASVATMTKAIAQFLSINADDLAKLSVFDRARLAIAAGRAVPRVLQAERQVVAGSDEAFERVVVPAEIAEPASEDGDGGKIEINVLDVGTDA